MLLKSFNEKQTTETFAESAASTESTYPTHAICRSFFRKSMKMQKMLEYSVDTCHILFLFLKYIVHIESLLYPFNTFIHTSRVNKIHLINT